MPAAAPDPLIHIAGLRKHFGGLRPLRINALSIDRSDRIVLHGLDAEAAEMLTLLITGASLPDEGSVTVAGRETRDIQTDTDWLASLDIFGMVTSRAALMDSVAVEGNMALPFTLSIDPMPDAIRGSVAALASEVGLPAELLPGPVGCLNESQRARVHLARALAMNPQVLLLEHPTARLAPNEAASFGELLPRIADRRRLAWLAVSEDESFARAAGGRRLRLDAASGNVSPARGVWRLW